MRLSRSKDLRACGTDAVIRLTCVPRGTACFRGGQLYPSTSGQLLVSAEGCTSHRTATTAKTSDRVLALYEEGVIPQAALSLESTMAAYEVGSVDFLTLLSSLTTLLDFEMQYYAELTKHEQALARLEPLLGVSLTQP